VEDWENFAYTTAVNITRNKIMRTRPRFSSWKAKFTVSTDASVCTAEQLKRWIDAAGHLVGIGDWRPEKCGHYGRYTAEVTEVSK
jgi:hypothetical protein